MSNSKNDDTTPETGTDVETITPKTNGVVAPRASERFIEYVQNRAAVEAPLVADQLAFDQMDKILQATTPEELDAAMKIIGVKGLKDFDNGTELEIVGFHLSPGTREEFKNRLGAFTVMQTTLLETGETAFIDTGVERVIAWLRGCEVMERFPIKVRVVKTSTGRGNDMITLLPIPKRVVAGK